MPTIGIAVDTAAAPPLPTLRTAAELARGVMSCAARRGLYGNPPENDRAANVTNFVFRRSFRIQWAHCDPAGIVFNPRFFEFFDSNSWLMFEAALGIPAAKINATFGLVGLALVDAQASFMKPAAFGDTVELASRVGEFRRSSLNVEHRLTSGDDVLVEGRETRVWAVRHKDDPDRIATAPIPPEVMAKFG
jgi:4-hydroxybenzoyl-CoA thioesterase